MAATAAVVGPAITVICPECSMPLTLHLGRALPQPGGWLSYDGELGRAGIRLHLRVGCEAM